jgi:hypothetical protein
VSARSPQEIRGSIERTRGELAQSVEDLRVKMRVITDWRRQLDEHRTAAIAVGAVAGFLIGRKLFRRRS